MRILVFGAGPLGSLFAARLKQGGHEVTLLARRPRLTFLRKNGIILRNWQSGLEETVPIDLIESLKPNNSYDLIMVIMRKNSALKILPILAANRSPLVLFLMNNAAGPDELMIALGEERVLIGFPGAAGYREGQKMVYINAAPEHPAMVYMGLPGGGESDTLKRVAAEISKGMYLQTKIETCMDAWSKYHVALLFPSIGPALYLCGNDNYRMSRTRDAIVLALRAIHEGFRVLQKLGYPATPSVFKRYLWIPEPLMVKLLSRILRHPRMEVAMVRHAEVIRDEIQQLNSEFMKLVEKSGIFTPNIRFLVSQFNQRAPGLPEGSHSIRLDWSGIILPVLLVMFLLMLLILWIK